MGPDIRSSFFASWVLSQVFHSPVSPSSRDSSSSLLSAIRVVEHNLVLFLGIGMKIDLFQSCSHCWVFQICWHIEDSTITAHLLGFLNSSAEILSPPWALLAAVLPKAHLTSHSRMSGSRWVTVPSWLSWSLRLYLYSSVYSLHIF